MVMDQSPGKIEPKGIFCILCLNFEKGPGLLEVQRGKGSLLGFKLIMRYLESDIDIAEMLGWIMAKYGTRTVFCDKCEFLVGQFKDWYQDFEMMRLLINNSIHKLLDGMKERENQEEDIVCSGSFVEIHLRKETLKRGFNKLCSVPKVSLDKARNETEENQDLPKNGERCSTPVPIIMPDDIKHDINMGEQDIKTEIIDENDDTTSEITYDMEDTDEKILTLLPVLLQEELVVTENEQEKIHVVDHVDSKNCILCTHPCREKNIKERNLGFNLFMRYLDINMCKMDNIQSGVLLCENCEKNVNQFWQLYQDFEMIRLFMNNSIQDLVNVINQSENCSLRVNQFRKEISKVVHAENSRLVYPMTHNLRKEVLKICSQKLISVPRVKIKRFENLNDSHDPLNILPEETAEHEDRDKIDIKIEPFLSHQFNFTTAASSTSSEKRPDKNPSDKQHSVYEYNYNYKKGRYKRPTRFNCRFCSKSFFGTGNTNLHMLVSHSYQLLKDKIPPHVSQSKFETTFQKIATSGKRYGNRKVGCPYCVRSTRDDIIRGHVLECHLDKILLALEDTKGIFDEPPQAIHNLKENPSDFKCPKCEKTLDGKLSLHRHLMRHSRNNCCRICSQRFAMLHQLHAHEISAHPMSKLKNELPPGTTEKQLENVLQEIMGHKRQSLKKKVFCHLCKVWFRRRYPLRTHLLQRHLKTIIERLGEK